MPIPFLGYATIAIGLLAFTPLAGNRAFGQDPEGYEWTFPAMGTTVTFQTFSEDSERVRRGFEIAKSEVERLITIFSDYDEDSELMLIVQDSNVGRWQSVSRELWQVLQSADQWYALSDGKFDPSIGPVTRLWRQARRKKTVPEPAAIESAMKRVGWQGFEIDPMEPKVKIMRTGQQFDLGAIAKGFIMDCALDSLKSQGLPQSLVRSGGDMRCGDAPPGREGWRIEIGVLTDDEKERPRLLLCNEAIATSGDLFQFVVHDGKRLSHVLNARTGQAIEGPRAATVIAPTAMQADAAATTLCILGNEEGFTLVSRLPGIEARIARQVMVDQMPKVESVQSPGLEKRLLPID